MLLVSKPAKQPAHQEHGGICAMILVGFTPSSVEIWREFPPSSCREFTKTVRNNPLLEQLSQTTSARFPPFAPNSYISAQKVSNIRAIYQKATKAT
jgi:hypothetical protein